MSALERLLRRQTELSVATSIFYASGGLIASLSVTLFFDAGNTLNVENAVIAVLCFALAAAIFVAGDRFGTRLALVLICVSAILVLCLVALSSSQLRAHTTGLLYYTYLLYLIWFGDPRFARFFGWAWLACYWVIMLVRYGETSVPMLVSLTVTSMMIGELVSHFKRRLEKVSLTDPLCGVWNRRGFQGLFGRSLQIARRSGEPLSLLFLDLDDFKKINDTLGHRAGDDVLRAFVAQVQAECRAQDTLARLGGDEFVLLLPDTDERQARLVAERLRGRVSAAEWSYGAAELQEGEQIDDLLARAGAGMRADKQQRKNL